MCGDPQELGCFARRLAVPVPEGQGKGRGRLPRCFCDHTKLVFPSEVSNLADESLMADGLTSFFPALSPPRFLLLPYGRADDASKLAACGHGVAAAAAGQVSATTMIIEPGRLRWKVSRVIRVGVRGGSWYY